MSFWFKRAGNAVIATHAEPDYSGQSNHCPGLSLLLDAQCRVLRVTGAASHGLKWPAGTRPLALDAYLTDGSKRLCGDLSRWQRQALDLSFRCEGEQVLHARGWLQPAGADWLLQMIDVGDVAGRLQQYEERLGIALYAGELANSLRSVGAARLPELGRELLQGLAQKLRIPCVALALPVHGSNDWYIQHQYHRHGQATYWLVGQRLGSQLQRFEGGQPVQWHLAEADGKGPHWFAGESIWLVPYRENNQVCAWLLCSPYDAARQAPNLEHQDWLQLFAQFASPLLQRMGELDRRAEAGRNEVLQRLLGAGWWEFLPQRQEMLLAPSLLSGLGVEGGGAMALSSWLNLIDQADRDEFRVRLGETVQTGKPFVQCVRLLAAEQPPSWYRIHAQVLGSGERQRIVGFALDINDIKAKEAEADAANARLENLVASAPAVIYVQRYQDGALLPEFCSASLQALLGWTLADLCEASIAGFVHPDDREAFYARTRTLLREGSVSCRYRLLDRDGEYHWLQDEAKLLSDERGLPLEAVGLWLDVTEATLAAERVRESEERYRVLVEDSPAMICRYRPDLTLTFANLPLASYLETEPDKLKGVSLGKFLTAEQQRQFVERLRQLTPERPVSTAQVRLQLPGHGNAWWVWADRGLFDADGTLVEVQAVGRDDTELYSARQQLNQSAKMATLGEMATGLAHEINQPLNVIKVALANVLLRLGNGTVPVDYLKGKLERIEGQVSRAARIVDHMRIFGRRSEIERQLVDPRQAIAGSVALFREGSLDNTIELLVEVDDLPSIQGHGDQLEQVFINLLVNARDALFARRASQPAFKPRITVHGKLDGQTVTLEVEDNGGGIEPWLLDRVFEPFFTTKAAGQGTGLGLSVSYGLVQQMGGLLSVQNRGEGACFRIALPVAEQPQGQD